MMNIAPYNFYPRKYILIFIPLTLMRASTLTMMKSGWSAITFGNNMKRHWVKEHMESTIHRIAIDKLGNLVDAPRSYRSFFLKERTAFITGKR